MPPKKYIGLSPMETETAYWVAQGLPNREIAIRRGIVPQAVTNEISRILDKLCLSNRVEIALWVMRNNVKPSFVHDVCRHNPDDYGELLAVRR